MIKQAFLSLVFASALMATPVTYDTNGIFTGPDAIGGSLFNKGALVTFNNVASVTVDSPTNISLGVVTVTPPTSGTAVFAGDTLTLSILEISPSSGSGPTQAQNITGTITTASDTLTLTFAPAVIVIGSETYTLEGPYELVAPNTNSGTTSIQAFLTSAITTIPVPEPAGLGILALISLVSLLKWRKS